MFYTNDGAEETPKLVLQKVSPWRFLLLPLLMQRKHYIESVPISDESCIVSFVANNVAAIEVKHL